MGYILDKKTIVEISHQLRKKGNKVVFTHGTFDLFHAGHASFLSNSKKLGDILIVGVEDNKRVKIFYGNKNPIIDEKERLEIVCEQKFTDFVFLLSDKVITDRIKGWKLIYKELYPNVITYGRDFGFEPILRHTLRGIEYKQVMDKYGGKFSTTKIIEKIKNAP